MINDSAFATAPTLCKVATGGHWERAVVFQPGQMPSEAEVLERFGSPEEVACEAFFGQAFFGVRKHGPDVAGFVVAFTDALASAGSGQDFFRSMAGMGIILETGFQFAEIGAEGAWNSVGAFRIMDPCAALKHIDSVWREIAAAPVGQDTAHNKAVEFTFAAGATHWLALPVSESGVLARAPLEEALRTFCDWSQSSA